MSEPSYLIIATVEHRPWWGLGFVKGERFITMASPPGMTRQQAEEARLMFLEAEGCLGARLEVIEPGKIVLD